MYPHTFATSLEQICFQSVTFLDIVCLSIIWDVTNWVENNKLLFVVWDLISFIYFLSVGATILHKINVKNLDTGDLSGVRQNTLAQATED